MNRGDVLLMHCHMTHRYVLTTRSLFARCANPSQFAHYWARGAGENDDLSDADLLAAYHAFSLEVSE